MTDHSTAELFGNHAVEPVIKEKGNNYQPNFVDVAPEERRFKEVFGEDKIPNNTYRNEKLQQKKNENEVETDAYGKKMNSNLK